MARPRKSRTVTSPPRMKGFKPFGLPLCELETLRLSYEEYESIKLIDYDHISQTEAAVQMNISRPTFTRIYNKALKTIAKAFVEGKAIEIEGGDYSFNLDWYRCNKCNKLIKGHENHYQCEDCPILGSGELERLNKI